MTTRSCSSVLSRQIPCQRYQHQLNTAFSTFFVPATSADVNTCKTILSAAVLNYSTPTLVNWQHQYNDPGLASGGSHLAKIPGVLRYLSDLGPENDNDLIVVIDGYDVWFQLTPGMLLARFHDINQRANQ